MAGDEITHAQRQSSLHSFNCIRLEFHWQQIKCTERSLMTRIWTFCHMKLTQSTALEQERFDLWSISPALGNLWLSLV